MTSKMLTHDAKKDYLEGWCILQFDGEYDEKEALEYIQKCYPDITKVVKVSHPYTTERGYPQTGTVQFE